MEMTKNPNRSIGKMEDMNELLKEQKILLIGKEKWGVITLT